MIIFRLLKHRFTSILITLLITLQMTACSSEDLLTAAAPGIDSGATTENGTGTTTENENNVSTDITLAWIAPAEREDNSSLSLSDIAGYKVYFGTTQGQYSNSLTINDGSATGYTFNVVATATYYFVVTTIDTEGRESQYSPEVTIVT